MCAFSLGDWNRRPAQENKAEAADSVLVPREPTMEMLIAAGTMAGYDIERETIDSDHIAWWKDMLAAAPSRGSLQNTSGRDAIIEEGMGLLEQFMADMQGSVSFEFYPKNVERARKLLSDIRLLKSVPNTPGLVEPNREPEDEAATHGPARSAGSAVEEVELFIKWIQGGDWADTTNIKSKLRSIAARLDDAERRCADAKDDALRLHREKMKYFDRNIELQRRCAEFMECLGAVLRRHGFPDCDVATIRSSLTAALAAREKVDPNDRNQWPSCDDDK